MLSVRQFIVLAVALAAALAAALLIRNMAAPATPPAAVAEQVTGQQVLIAARDVPQGTLLTAADFEWRRLPDDAVGPTFITETTNPDALTAFVGAVTLRPVALGEPLQTTTLVMPGEGGIIAAQVPPGYRAVAVTISDASAAGGYIQPNDRVDVILTTTSAVPIPGGASRDEVKSDVILEDVRVLAVGSVTRVERPEEGEGPEPNDAGTAVLELSQGDSRAIAMAEALGELRLVLRGVQAEPPGLVAPSAQRWRAPALEQSMEAAGGVRVHAFGSTDRGVQ
jgi:pilus assembly protein CpaB